MSRQDSVTRLRRLLAVLPWIAAHQGAELSEIAAAFDVPVDTLRRDLELVPLCGLPPYTPDRLVDLAIVDGAVTVKFAEYFGRPLRLSRDEAVALVATGRMLLALSGSDEGPLASGVAKLEGHLGVAGGIAVSSAADAHSHELLGLLREAAAGRRRVELEYYAAGRNATTRRRADPLEVFFAEGNWYCWAFCHLRESERLFRVDRVHAVDVLDEDFEPPEETARPADIFHPSDDDPRVELELPPDAAWVIESYPTEAVEELPDGRRRVRLVVSEQAWLERLLLRCGPEARVVGSPAFDGVARDVAARVLARYDEGP